MGTNSREEQVSFRTDRATRRLIARMVDEAKYDFGLTVGRSKFNLQHLGNAMILYLASLGPAERRVMLEEGLRLLDARVDPSSDEQPGDPKPGREPAKLDNPKSLSKAPNPPPAGRRKA